MKIAISGREPWNGLAQDAAGFIRELQSCGASLRYSPAFVSSMRSEGVELPCGEIFAEEAGVPSDTDIFLALGGDGTFLSSIVSVRDSNVPIAGINFGRLGFLTAATAGREVAEALVSGRFEVQDRALLKVEARGLDKDFWPYALNEISFQRSGAGLLSIEVSLDGKELPPYWADGILIATPTGSTAYSLSVGGPVVTPGCDVMLITPIASHNLNHRPLVVPISSQVDIRVSGRTEIALAADNRFVRYRGSVNARISRSGFSLKYISFQDNNFITALRSKLMWGADGRNQK